MIWWVIGYLFFVLASIFWQILCSPTSATPPESR